MEIRWQRHIAVIGNNSGEVATGSNGGGAIAENFLDSNNVSSSRMVGEILDSELVTNMELAAIHDMVDFAGMFLEHNKFTWAAIGQLSEDARAHDASVVEDDEIASREKIGEISIM